VGGPGDASSTASGVIRNYTSPISFDSKITFIIFVELELYPGKTIPASKQLSLRCNRNFEGIRKAFAQLRGFQYRPIPMNTYDDVEKNINPSYKKQNMQNFYNRAPYYGNNNRSRNTRGGGSGGRQNKTKKNRRKN
jgi:hypothetical protein